MARCGCSSGQCGCVVTAVAGSGITVLGDGTPGSPYSLNLDFTTWQNITGTYVNGFSAYTGTAADVPQYRVAFGGKLIFLRGRILGTSFTPVNTPILNGAPTAIRPVRNKWLVTASGATSGDNGILEVTPAGGFVNQAALPQSWISLDGLMYEHD